MAMVMDSKAITSAYSRQHAEQKRPTALLIFFGIVSFTVLASSSWRRRGNKLLFWALTAVTAMIAAVYFLMFRDVPLHPIH
jgi:hypothetical protein